MPLKTQVHATDGRQELTITREFDLPVELVYRAYTETELVAQWMGTRVLKLENTAHGCYQFETTDPDGNVVFRANGTIHAVVHNQQIIRTFEMENSPFPVQLEFLEFEARTAAASHLTIHTIFKSVADRDRLLELPFAMGLNMAHNRLEQLFHQPD